jgi:glycosyltransferase involved in cell wall biosynthesis
LYKVSSYHGVVDVTGATTTLDLLDAVRIAPTLLAGIELFDALAEEVRSRGDEAVSALAQALADEQDQLTAIAAVHAATAGGASMAERLVVPLLDSEVGFLHEHAAWALRSCPPLPDAVHALRAMASTGGFSGVLAEATLEAWGFSEEGRGHDDLGPDGLGAAGPVQEVAASRGLTVAQLFLHADIDGSLQQSGKGDTGGIATLLVHLGDALVENPRVDRVVTLSRSRDGGRLPDGLSSPGHHYVGVPLPGPVRSAAEAWPLRVPVRQGLRRALEAAAPVDVLHLRMADVGSWVAAEVAHDLGIPTVLTLAPDPHALIAAREAAGSLTRRNVGEVDLVEHLVFRVRLLRDLAAGAAGLVAFPRARFERDLRTLLHVDPDERSVVVVPEGIDLAPLDRAVEQVAAVSQGLPVPAATTGALDELDALLATLPPERRGLPLAVTVGRMHRVKGMATLVQAWADDPAFAKQCNLLVVGGDLDDPSCDEAEQLALIDRAVPAGTAAERGLLLAGHRPNGTVATWLAAVQGGRRGLSAPGGVYVSASLKEEFGIAILEALASGLVVVAPQEGGPATYVEDGVTGFLVDTTSPGLLAAAVVSALDLASSPDASVRAEKARAAVAHDFGIATMASSLSRVYTEVAR